MQFIEDLYNYGEKEIIDIFWNNCDKYLEDAWKNFVKYIRVYRTDKYIEQKYCVNVKSKKRYINSLVYHDKKISRIYYISIIAKQCIDKYVNLFIDEYYTYFDFDFKIY